jgi:hypothetical protein
LPGLSLAVPRATTLNIPQFLPDCSKATGIPAKQRNPRKITLPKLKHTHKGEP